MPEPTLDARRIHSVTDFLRNYKAHLAHLKETRTPEVLTVNGRAEAVLLDAESYQELMERVRRAETLPALQTLISQGKAGREKVTEAEIERSQVVVEELMAETERLGLYK